MIPRLAKVPAPAPLHVAFLAELRARGFEGQLSLTHADRTVLSTDNSIYQVFPQAIAFPASTDDLVRIATARRRAALSRAQAGAARRRHRHQRPVADRRARRRPVAPHEPHPGDRSRAAARSGRGRGGEGPAQQGAGAARPVLRAGAVDLQPRHHRRHDQHRRVRPGLLHLRQDQPPCAVAHHRAARRHGLDLAPAGRGGAPRRSRPAPTGSGPSTGW